MSISYNFVGNTERGSITVDDGERFYTADNESHGNFKEIVRAAIEGDPSVVDLFDMRVGIERRFEAIGQTGRVSFNDDGVYLDGDPAPQAISDAIMSHYAEGLDFSALVAFLEKLANNPSPRSVEQLYPWLEANDGFTITEDGDLIAYKGVAIDDNGDFVSVNHGTAIVNGTVVTGAIPNSIGDTVSMPRSEVMDDSAIGCAQGLHAGTYNYAEGWARGALLEVVINPRDVVSVPTECESQKLRVSRYQVLDVINAPHTVPVRGHVSEPFDPWNEGWRVDTDDEDYYPELDEDELDLRVGDHVEIVDDLEGNVPQALYNQGVIVSDDGLPGYPYQVRTTSGHVYYCAYDELERV